MLSLRIRSQIQDIIQNIHDHILAQPPCNEAQPFGGFLSDSSLLLTKPINKHINNFLQIFFIDITIVIQLVIMDFLMVSFMRFIFGFNAIMGICLYLNFFIRGEVC